MAIDLGAKPVEIVVTPYHPAAARFPKRLAASLAASVEEYANELVAALHLNCTSAVTVTPDPARHDSLRPVHVKIGGMTCAQPVTGYESSPKRFMDALHEHVQGIVCHNRQLFVSERLARDYRRAWGLEQEADEFLFGLLSVLAARGFSLARAKTWLDAGGRLESGIEAAFEEAAGAPTPVQVSLPEDAREHRRALSSDLPRLCADLGVAAVDIVTRFHHLRDEWAYRLQVNDLPLPAVRTASVAPNGKASSLPGDALLHAIVADIDRHLPLLVTAGRVDAQLDALGQRCPLLEREVRRRFSTGTLAALLRALAEHGLPAYDLKSILESALTTNGSTVAGHEISRIVVVPETANYCFTIAPRKGSAFSIGELVETARTALRRQITRKIAPDNQVSAILLGPDLSRRLAGPGDDRLGGDETWLVFKELNRQLSAWRAENPSSRNRVVLLTEPESHAAVSAACRDAFPDLPVLSFFDLDEDAPVTKVARIELSELPDAWTTARDAIQARDAHVDRALTELPADTSSDLDAMLSGMVKMQADLEKLKVREEQVRQADDDDIRELTTQELVRFESEMEKQKYIKDRRPESTDMVSDWVSGLTRKPRK